MSQGAGGGRILVVGDVMTDIIVKPEGPLVCGSDRRASIRSRPGGSGANQAVWLGAMGTRVSFVARVGAADKPHLEAYFKGFCVDPVLVADALLPSGMLVTIVDPDGERSFLTDRGANLALSPSDMPVWLLDDTSMVLGSGYSYFADGPRRAVPCLTEEARRRGIPLAVDAASAGFLAEVGAADFLAKPVDAAALIGAVRSALETAQARRQTIMEAAELANRLATLTPREREVMEHVVAGKLNKQIAAELGTGEQNIKLHRAHIMKKMGVQSLADLVRAAERLRG